MLALLAQLEPADGSPGDDALRAAAVIRQYPEAEIAVFPELFLGGYRLEGADAVACDPWGDQLLTVVEACTEARTAAIVGFTERYLGGLYDSLACIDSDGEPMAIYRKAQLFGHEADVFRPGSHLEVVELAGRRVAPLVCFDVEFPELARSAALAGADLLVTCAANMEPYGREHRLHAAARALENRLPHLYVNRVGSEAGLNFVGESCAIDAAGVVLREAGAEEQILLAEVGAAGTGDAFVDYLDFEPTRMPVEVRSKSHSKGGTR
jgi:predicted amidohydrolase